MVYQKQMMAKFGNSPEFRLFALLPKMLTLRIEVVFMVHRQK